MTAAEMKRHPYFSSINNKCKFRWTISEFSKKLANVGDEEELKSFKFPCVYNNEIFYFTIRISPMRSSSGIPDCLSIYLNCDMEKDCASYAEITLSLLNKEEDKFLAVYPVNTKRRIKTFNNECLFLSKFYNEYLVNDTFGISCEITMNEEEEDENRTYKKNLRTWPDYTKSYCDAFNNFLEMNVLSDVTIFVENKKIPAHRVILAARCPVLCAMLTNRKGKFKTNVIEIENFSFNTIYEMIRFIYSNRVNDIDDVALELLPVADKFKLYDLKSMCAEALYKSLSIDNAVQILLLADLYNELQLRTIVIQFINNYLADVMKTEGWNNITFSCLKDLYTSLSLKFQKYTVVEQVDDKLEIK